MAKKTGIPTLAKVGIGIGAVGLTFIVGTSIAGAVNNRSFVDEIKSWGQQEKQVNNQQTPEDDTNVEVEPTANIIAIFNK